MVHRGKYTEGINFKDNRCRAIIMVGVPFACVSDAKINLKRKFYEKLDNNKSLKGNNENMYQEYYFR